MSTYAELKAQHCQDLFARLPEMIAHIGGSQEQLRVERERRLRELIHAAVTRSTWHHARLSGLDPRTLADRRRRVARGRRRGADLAEQAVALSSGSPSRIWTCPARSPWSRASRGIGLAIVRALAAEGASVVA
jgi:hypothetical protein